MKAKTKYPYPMIECDVHPGPQHGYCVCHHVIEGWLPEVVERADSSSAGILSCDDCFRQQNVKDFKLVCEQHAIENGWLSAEKGAT